MVKKKIAFLVLILIVKCSISQTGYPKLVLINSDTVCAVTIAQLDSINAEHINLMECRELKDSLDSQFKVCEDLVKDQKEIISSQDKEIKIQKDITGEKNKLLAIEEDRNKKLERKAKWLKLQRNILTVAVVALTGALLL